VTSLISLSMVTPPCSRSSYIWYLKQNS